ncbi:MAG TPA: YebC/PmpR family DNA-binding transcriptional regulator, partial [Actinobacteria bacterium]|nr:YebC/PmpR family DNA-binding transcriptional regulator [Actinomycetota bacterium]
EEIWYEGYAPGGVALLVQVLTDNRNRAASDVRATFTRHGGSLGEPGSVSYLFEQRGLVLARGDEEPVLLAALEAGAEDVRGDDDEWEIVTGPGDVDRVRAALEDAGVEIESAEVTRLPTATVPLDAAGAPRVLRLVEALEDLDDVQAVYANFEIPDELLAEVT